MYLQNYLIKLQEQNFNPSMRISALKGDMNRRVYECYENRCKNIDASFDKSFCKASCKIISATNTLNRVNSLRGLCSEMKNPASCLKILDNSINSLRKIIEKSRESQRETRVKAAEFRRKLATGV